MSESEDNPFLITPPPGFAPTPAAEPDEDQIVTETALITPPPGIETGTFKMAQSRAAEDDKIVTLSPKTFTTPGGAILPVGKPRVVPAAPEPAAVSDLVADAEPVAVAAPAAEPVAFAEPAVVADPVAVAEPVAEETQLAPQRSAPAASAGPTWRLVMPHGDAPVEISGAVVIGRGPVTIPEYATAQLVTASDPSKSVSKTHALLGIDAKGLWVADLGSTNGTFVITPTGGDVRVQPGAPVYVPPGSDVELGQYVITVELG